jgi:YegS/Rv2252/BmrU family lipid kinase
MPQLSAQAIYLLGSVSHEVNLIIYPGIRSIVITKKRHTVIIFNPRAGKLLGNGNKGLERAAGILRANGQDAELVPTTGPSTAGEIARRAIAGGAGVIVAAGGDGTINEVAEGMVHSRVPLGILPAGTANVLAMETGMSTNLERAAREMADYRAERIAVGGLRFRNGGTFDRHFLLMAGIGLDAQVVYNIHAPLKARLGKVAYWVAGFSLVGTQLPEFEVRVDGKSYLASFALVSRIRNYGGDLEIARSTSLLDDQFEVVLFTGRNSARYLKYFSGVVLNRLRGMAGVTILRAEKVCIPQTAERVHVQVDGEHAGKLPASLKIVPDAITLLLPPKYLRRLRLRESAAVRMERRGS